MREWRLVFWFLMGVGAMLLLAPSFVEASDRHAKAAATATSSSTSTATGGDAVATAAGGAAEASNQLDQTINQSQSLITINGNNQPAAQGQKLLAPNSTGTVGAQNDGEATGDISVLSPSTSVTIENPDDIKIRNVPSMVAPDIFPTTSCFKGASGSLAVTGFGISGGAGSIDEGCVEREEIRLAHAMGMQNRALWRWCNLPNNVESFGSAADCMAFDPTGEETTSAGDYHVNEYEAATLARAEVASLEREMIEPLREDVQNVNASLDAIQARLDANAAAARRARQEEAQWKQKIAETYLPE